MTEEERRLITDFVRRAVSARNDPIDPEADRLLAELFVQYPEARYRIAQMAFFGEHALAEATNRIRELEWQLQEAQQPRGFFGGLVGGAPARGQPPPPAHAPGWRPGLFSQQPGGSFLGTAAATALGVLGGLMIGQAIASMMGLGGEAQAAEGAEELSRYHETGFDTGVFDEEL